MSFYFFFPFPNTTASSFQPCHANKREKNQPYTDLFFLPSSLKLKLYRTLGIDVEADPTTGQYNKAVIRNAAKGDVHVVNIDPKFSRHFYTNYFWRTM